MARPKGSPNKPKDGTAPKRQRKGASTAPAPDARVTGLLDALKFASIATHDIGEPYATHFYIGGGWAVGFDGTVMAAQPVADDLLACPHAGHLMKALERSGGAVSLTQLEGGRLAVKGERLRVVVECLDPSTFPLLPPDPTQGPIDDATFRAGLNAVAVLASDNAPTVLVASVLVTPTSYVATDRHLMLEFWHGVGFPTLVLPKTFVTALSKINRKIIGMGVSSASVTVHFEGGSFLRSQLYSEPWPESWPAVFDPEAYQHARPLPASYWEAFDAVKPFSGDGYLYHAPGKLCSHSADGVGAEYPVEGIVPGPAVQIKRMELCRPLFDGYAFNGDRVYMFGKSIRGAMILDAKPQHRNELTEAAEWDHAAPPPKMEPDATLPRETVDEAHARIGAGLDRALAAARAGVPVIEDHVPLPPDVQNGGGWV